MKKKRRAKTKKNLFAMQAWKSKEDQNKQKRDNDHG